MTITINGTTGIAGVDGSASTPAVQGADTNTGIFFPAADTIAFGEGGAEAMRIDSSGNVGIGTSTTTDAGVTITTNVTRDNFWNAKLALQSTGASNYPTLLFSGCSATNRYGAIVQTASTSGNDGNQIAAAIEFLNSTATACNIVFSTSGNFGTTGATERARITSDGYLLLGKTAKNNTDNGLWAGNSTYEFFLCNTRTDGNGSVLYINRQGSDGILAEFRQADAAEGNISVSGTTVSYNGGHLSRWAQMPGTKDDTLLKGTVMSNLDEMNVYIAPTTYWTEEDELPEGVNVGDVKVETHEVENEQLNNVKVSDVEGDANVAGVFVNWSHDEQHNVDEINMAMTGDMIIRIAQGVVVQKGDLLMSAGDGTAKPQDDDIVRSKTVAKVTSNHVTCTYADGSYCVPCVLMAC
jgi:hypothetical protein